jgi:hypothetical protein
MEPKVPFGKIFFPAIKNANGNAKIIGGEEAVPRKFSLNKLIGIITTGKHILPQYRNLLCKNCAIVEMNLKIT